MKKILILVAAILTSAAISNSQNINWRSFQDQKHVVTLNFGLDYGSSIGVGYGYKFKTRLMPILVNTEFSIPAGNDIFDDFKLKIGGQSEVAHLGNFSATVRAYGIIRHYHSDLVKIMNYGSELSAVAGYYKNKWYAAGEFGFDKAITSHIRNSEEMKGQYPDIKDGWYIPSGGNYFYGIQTGYSFRTIDVTLKGGKTMSQGFRTSALLPYYLQVGLNKRF